MALQQSLFPFRLLAGGGDGTNCLRYLMAAKA
jgi:hypothetical protein